ncbi:low molecular weight phosphotyrosine protein phosphatase [Alphaproteobacteria bacterium GH1-50]|uniref:protein-tyrosine-phosphatase n=1 Tax=Kangsaoukella pontilimi TaxID=2691042 RepID=A0A7C9MBA7_9RHOB|nr:low molecular weight protein-tyrosine-phosphatase [Kangsaoukella pontilimi]MXQ08613.1 low molecular weight phosphotyrosine protein phosphatase [Kangsaoukella pontilimi]
MSRVLFVCLGNICRSPTAEAVFRVIAPEVEADSAGTGDWHIGHPPHPPAIRAAEARGFPMSDLRARQFTVDDFDAFDLIVAMDRQNLSDIERLRPSGNATPVRLMLDYLPDAPTSEVPDPYYTGDFDEALDLITGAARHLRAALQFRDAD